MHIYIYVRGYVATAICPGRRKLPTKRLKTGDKTPPAPRSSNLRGVGLGRGGSENLNSQPINKTPEHQYENVLTPLSFMHACPGYRSAKKQKGKPTIKEGYYLLFSIIVH